MEYEEELISPLTDRVPTADNEEVVLKGEALVGELAENLEVVELA